jgi:hypothetical protein
MFRAGTPNTHVNMGSTSDDGLEMDFFRLTSTVLVATKDAKVQQNTSTAFFIDPSGGQLNSISIGKSCKYTVFGGTSKVLYIYDQAGSPKLFAKFPGFSTNINSVRISKN